MNAKLRTFAFLMIVMLGGCATLPTGPSVMVLPGAGKTFQQFQADDAVCRQWARQQIGLSPQEAVNQNTASGAAVGTAIGAGLGAAIGAASGAAGTGAAIGAASGLMIGTAQGSSAGEYYGWQAQQRYDIAYQQCMYLNGNVIPGMRVRNVRRMPPPPPPDLSGPVLNETSPVYPPPQPGAPAR
ncbi:MAG TPA: glycine zipper family protein [Nitrospirota bacterium]|nr:glycine zipper family protein [Nitrospirota bacterium]